ncbi:MAG: hypothetical protein KatS3mg039_0379 [Candidatus Kapaibacterium sp.]|nr:MAG: hypothetical protein KatS3mg039_0379 [Candidatus Kapabacteria bacterium]
MSAGTYTYTLVVTCGSCSATSNSVTVTVSPSPSVTISANGSTSLCVGYSSGPTLTSSVSNCSGTAQYQWHSNGEPDQWRDEFELHGAGRLECGDVRVHGGCDVRQLQCDVKQRDGDRQPIAERDDQRQWFDEPVRWVFERSDADLLGEQLQRDGAVPVDAEQPIQWRDEFELHGAGRLECGDVRVHAGCDVWQLQCDIE